MSAIASDPTLGTTSTIGRYFGIVSVVPSVFFTVWTYLLVASKPWDGPPDLSAITRTDALQSIALGAGIVLLSLIVAVVTHPLQFLTVQLMEGYWGPGPLGRAWQERCILRHVDRRHDLADLSSPAREELEDLAYDRGEKNPAQLDWPAELRAGTLGPIVTAYVADARATAALALYPDLYPNTMPTRLGNVLRRHEANAGVAVGLDLITWANHIGMVADPAHTAYVQDQRNSMDLAVRMTVTCLAMFALTFLFLWPHGWWLLVALAPLGSAWLSYRGAIVAADGYGRALTAWLHLNRFRLYDALHLPSVYDASSERRQNKDLDAFIRGRWGYRSRYQQAASSTPPGRGD